ncbi:hypothetical protein NHX12_024366, partial [Muraenolepis orangiensis]
DKAQQELLMVRQRLEDKLRQESHALCAGQEEEGDHLPHVALTLQTNCDRGS